MTKKGSESNTSKLHQATQLLEKQQKTNNLPVENEVKQPGSSWAANLFSTKIHSSSALNTCKEMQYIIAAPKKLSEHTRTTKNKLNELKARCLSEA